MKKIEIYHNYLPVTRQKILLAWREYKDRVCGLVGDLYFDTDGKRFPDDVVEESFNALMELRRALNVGSE